MKVNVVDFEPTRLLTYSELLELLALWKSKAVPLELQNKVLSVSLGTKLPNFPEWSATGESYINIFPIAMWTYQSISMVRNFFNKLELLKSNAPSKQFSSYVTTLFDDYNRYKHEAKTQFGTLREILQSGHSVLLSFINDFKQNTFRTLVFADARNDATTLTVSEKNLQPFFGMCVPENVDVFKLPDHIALYIKRDPVIWLGSLQAITHIRVNRDCDSDCTGVSPFLFPALNMDIDGDTVIGYVVYDKASKKDQERYMLHANTFGNRNRWSLETNHITSLFASMLRSVGLDMEKLSNYGRLMVEKAERERGVPFKPNSVQELPLYPLFEKVLYELDHSAFWGEFNRLFEAARAKHKGNFGALMDYMMLISPEPHKLQQFIIDNMLNSPSIGLDNANTYYSAYNNIIFFVGISSNINLYVDFVEQYANLPDKDLSILQPVSTTEMEENHRRLNKYIDTSHQLPKDSNTQTNLHYVSEFTVYNDDTIYTAGVPILDKVSSVIPLPMVYIPRLSVQELSSKSRSKLLL